MIIFVIFISGKNFDAEKITEKVCMLFFSGNFRVTCLFDVVKINSDLAEVFSSGTEFPQTAAFCAEEHFPRHTMLCSNMA